MRKFIFILLFITVNLYSAEIIKVETDKARYEVNEDVSFDLVLDSFSDNLTLLIKYYHQDRIVKTEEVNPESEQVNWVWQTPAEDYKGYLVTIELLENNSKLDEVSIGVDVSSDWSKFPRYGFLSYFEPTHPDTIGKRIAKLNRFHINGLQFYDWHYKHHKPLKGTGDDPAVTWFDIANRQVYLYTVRNYINAARSRNMMSMGYNLIYGAFDNAATDGVSDEWRMFKDANHVTPDLHDLPSNWVSDIYLMNPENTNWQNHIIYHTKDAFKALDFDGWHVDQLGGRGTVYNYNGDVINVPQGFVNLLSKAKDSLQCSLVMNAVGQYAQQQIAGSEVDFLYSEVWEPNTTLEKLAEIIIQNDEFSGNQLKSVLAAYIHKELSGSANSFNPAAVLYADAIIFAFGGAHLELGEHMLCNEYFPNNNLSVSAELEADLVNYYDFLVAYQNLLRGDSEEIDELPTSTEIEIVKWRRALKVWSYAKQQGDKKIFHLINLADASTLDWRDNLKTQTAPTEKFDIPVTLSSAEQVYKVWFASPDYNKGAPQNIEFTQEDGNVSFNLPYLEYWDMIVFDYDPLSDVEEQKGVPTKYGLNQNYPNPFNPSTKISYAVKNSGHVMLAVYDILGNKVADLVNSYQLAGNYIADFNASGLSSGVYFYQLKTENFTDQKKMLFLK